MKPSLITLATAFLLGATALLAKPATPSAVNLRLEMDRTVLPAGTTEKAIIKVSLDGVRVATTALRPPVNLTLVLDRSGSMNGDKIVQAKAAAIEVLRRLSAEDLFSLVAYDSEVETLISAQRVGDGRVIEERIRSIRASGGTALFGGVTQGASELRKHAEDRRYINRLVLLSDGQANEGPSSPEELGRLGTALMKEGISVTTIGLGLGFNEDLMTRLAQKSDGNTYFVEASQDLARIFNAELGDVLNVVARQLVVTVEFPEGVRPLALVGRDGVIDGQKAQITLNQLYGGQEKFALIEVEVAPVKAGNKRDVARARLTFDDLGTKLRESKEAVAEVRFSEDQTVVIASANAKVQTDYALNRIAVAKDRAVALVDAGRRTEAAAVLRTSALELNSLGNTYFNSSVIAVSAANSMEADRLEKDGLSNVGRKTYRAENTQTMNQQSQSSSGSGSR